MGLFKKKEEQSTQSKHDLWKEITKILCDCLAAWAATQGHFQIIPPQIIKDAALRSTGEILYLHNPSFHALVDAAAARIMDLIDQQRVVITPKEEISRKTVDDFHAAVKDLTSLSATMWPECVLGSKPKEPKHEISWGFA